MKNKVFKNATEAFEHLFDDIIDNGMDRAGTKTLFNQGFYMVNPLENNIETDFRKFNLDYAEAEWQWYLSEDPSIKKLGELNGGKVPKIWKLMADELGLVRSNYGWQWSRGGQLDYVINELIRDPLSRKAVISIYDGKEHETYTKDTPCTGTIHFQIVHGALEMSVNMRSNDLVYGFCIDQYCFSKLQQMVALELGIEVGLYYHFASNLHIYERHYDMKSKHEDLDKIVNQNFED